jgi:hypothetical protein
MEIYRAKLETRNFEFEGFGVSAEDALRSLEMSLRIHGEAYELAHEWWSSIADEIEVEEITITPGRASFQKIIPTPEGII